MGTAGFLAPECCHRVPHSPAMDIWSLGMLLFTMLTGRMPYSHSQIERLHYPEIPITKSPGATVLVSCASVAGSRVFVERLGPLHLSRSLELAAATAVLMYWPKRNFSHFAARQLPPSGPSEKGLPDPCSAASLQRRTSPVTHLAN